MGWRLLGWLLAITVLTTVGCGGKAPDGGADAAPDVVAESDDPMGVHGSTLITEHYSITVFHDCPEGCVSCDKLIFHIVSRATGRAITLRGSTWHSIGNDGMPSMFRGYGFGSGRVTGYIRVTDGALNIYEGDSVLVSEKGVWPRGLTWTIRHAYPPQ